MPVARCDLGCGLRPLTSIALYYVWTLWLSFLSIALAVGRSYGWYLVHYKPGRRQSRQSARVELV